MGEASKAYPFEDFVEWVFGYRPNSTYVNSLRNTQQSTSMEETKELPSSIGCEKKNHFIKRI